jgi:8-oxo-dGTP diphosphatase
MRRKLRVAAYAICVADAELLMARFVGYGNRLWTLPGGGLEHGEDPYDAVIREVAEETGMVVRVDRLLGVDSAVRHQDDVDHHAVRIFYAATVIGGALRHEVGGSTDEARWMSLDRFEEAVPERGDLVDAGLALWRAAPPSGHLPRRP